MKKNNRPKLLKDVLSKAYNPISMFYLKLRDRNKEMPKARFHLFEYFIQMHLEFDGKEYHHSIGDIERDTSFSKGTIQKTLKYFEEIGLIRREVKRINKKTKQEKSFIQLDHTRIPELIPLMYDEDSNKYAEIKDFYMHLFEATDNMIDETPF